MSKDTSLLNQDGMPDARRVVTGEDADQALARVLAAQVMPALAETGLSAVSDASYVSDETDESGEPGDESSEESRKLARGPAMVEKFVIRLPSGLRQRIRQLSEQNRRSMNAEIILVLEKHIRQKFVDQMAEANPDGSFTPGDRHTEEELNRMLESLPAEKKEALLELLG